MVSAIREGFSSIYAYGSLNLYPSGHVVAIFNYLLQ